MIIGLRKGGEVSWEKEFDKLKLSYGNEKKFISSLLKQQREETMREVEKDLSLIEKEWKKGTPMKDIVSIKTYFLSKEVK